MPENFITLKCESCGAKLDVYGDMERFACGYCGTEMVVQRRGGTVALKLLQEAIKNVQIGTDKTAAELALVRLNDELKDLNAKALTLRNSGQGCLLGCGWILASLGVLLLLGISFSDMHDRGIGVVLGMVVLMGGVAMLMGASSKSPQEELKAIEARIEQVNGRIAEQRAIVNS